MTISRIIESVTSEGAPWVHQLIESQVELIREAASKADVLVIELDGSRMRTLDRLFAEYKERFSFPEYFGSNWNAFKECLGDLEWLPARKYLTIITHADEVLSAEHAELGTYRRVVQSVGKMWSTTVGLGYERGHGEIAFNTVFVEDYDVGRPLDSLAS